MLSLPLMSGGRLRESDSTTAATGGVFPLSESFKTEDKAVGQLSEVAAHQKILFLVASAQAYRAQVEICCLSNPEHSFQHHVQSQRATISQLHRGMQQLLLPPGFTPQGARAGNPATLKESPSWHWPAQAEVGGQELSPAEGVVKHGCDIPIVASAKTPCLYQLRENKQLVQPFPQHVFNGKAWIQPL